MRLVSLLTMTMNLFRQHLFENLTRNVNLEDEVVMTGKIYGGQYGTVLNHPHVAYLAICEKEYITTCGSSIINQYFLLTAAHCIYDLDPCCIYINVAAGTDNMNKITHLVESFKAHENYNEVYISNDIGLVKLTKLLEFGVTIKRVVVVRYPPSEEYGFVAGWGITDSKTNANTDYLKEAWQEILDPDDCFDPYMRGGKFCAGPVEKYDLYGYPHSGDSGSGLVVNNYVLVGIVSFSRKNNLEITFYTNVTYFYDWTRAGMRNLICHPGDPTNCKNKICSNK